MVISSTLIVKNAYPNVNANGITKENLTNINIESKPDIAMMQKSFKLHRVGI